MKIDQTLMDIAKEEGLKTVSDDLGSDSRYVYPFGCPPIDIPLGGGVIGGRVIELIGQESHGKTTIALEMTSAFANFWAKQKDENYAVLWIESESTIDLARAQFMGCPVHKILVYETDVFEHGRDKIKSMLSRCKKKGLRLFIVWDTIAACATLKEKEVTDLIEEEASDDSGKKKKTNPGGLVEKPRLIRQMFRDITVDLGKTGSTFIVVNQMTTQIGTYGAPLDSSGGKGLRHHASIRMEMRKVDDGKEEILPDGKRLVKSIICEIRYKKNKITGFTHIPTVVYIHKDTGVDTFKTRVLFMKQNKIVPAAAGGWTKYKIPVGYADKTKIKDGKPYVPGSTEIRWQNDDQLQALCETHPHLIDWFDYQIYLAYTNMSNLIKAKIIDKVWEYEDKFYGERRTTLTKQEQEVADILFTDLITKQDVENPNPDEAKPKKPAKSAKAKTQKAGKEKHASP